MPPATWTNVCVSPSKLLRELGLRQGIPDALRGRLDVDDVHVGGFVGDSHRCSFLETGAQSEQRDARAGGELAGPAVVDLTDGDRVQVVEPRSPYLARDDEACFLEHLHVLHDAEAGYVEPALELTERLSLSLEESIEDRAPCRIGKGPEKVTK